MTLYSGGKKTKKKCSEKGHSEEVDAFLLGISKGYSPISVTSQLATTLATLKILDSLASGSTQSVDLSEL